MLITALFLSVLASLTLSAAANSCKDRPLSDEEKYIILKWHNELRNEVASGEYKGQEPAKNMRELVWSEELASKAKEWAENCQPDGHDEILTELGMGQNLGSWGSEDEEVTDEVFQAVLVSIMDAWASEVDKFEGTSKNAGHYTQVIWARTSEIGCETFRSKENDINWINLVCDYKTAGNTGRKRPYRRGEPACEKYKMEQSPTYTNLCVQV
ncbi:hypothetical protein GE061_002956 [Apolygus lucorum]|uniref:Uncharacterized protein n=1 Tax=Apolygus lucorum TaxID=248454 RepID=A0A6A4JMB0_APOLU|nr:hypothetical protein GE061_002956 [Apolygus lucorum]